MRDYEFFRGGFGVLLRVSGQCLRYGLNLWVAFVEQRQGIGLRLEHNNKGLWR